MGDLPRSYPEGAQWPHMASHWASNMSPLGGSAEALWPQIFQNTLNITCFKALPKRKTPHIRMASHWACNMSPLGRAGAPALRAESAAPFAEGSTACWITARLCRSLQTPLDVVYSRAAHSAGRGPSTALDAVCFLPVFGLRSLAFAHVGSSWLYLALRWPKLPPSCLQVAS